MYALLAVGLGVACFAAGRGTAPLQVSERVEYRSLAVEDITRGYTFATQRVVYRNIVTTITDAGTTITDKSIEREAARTESTENVSRTESTEKKSEHVTTLRPAWSIGLQVGASLVKPALPLTGPLVIGASVDFRIAQSPFLIGVWANTVGTGGAELRTEF